jgi:transposase
MDYSPYDIAFTAEGTRRVHAFSYILAYSRRQYVRFVETQDFATTIREHIRAFEHLAGLATTCLYDNMKVVVTGYDGEQPIYNTLPVFRHPLRLQALGLPSSATPNEREN